MMTATTPEPLQPNLSVRDAMLHNANALLRRVKNEDVAAALDLVSLLNDKTLEFPRVLRCANLACRYEIRSWCYSHRDVRRATCQFVVIMPDEDSEFTWCPWLSHQKKPPETPMELQVETKEKAAELREELCDMTSRKFVAYNFAASIYNHSEQASACDDAHTHHQTVRHCFSSGELQRIVNFRLNAPRRLQRFCSKVTGFLSLSVPVGLYSVCGDRSVYTYSFEKIQPFAFSKAVAKATIAMEDFPREKITGDQADFVSENLERVVPLLPKSEQPKLRQWAQKRVEYSFFEPYAGKRKQVDSDSERSPSPMKSSPKKPKNGEGSPAKAKKV